MIWSAWDTCHEKFEYRVDLTTNRVQVRTLDSKYRKFRGFSKCLESDVFNLEYGILLATIRCISKINKKTKHYIHTDLLPDVQNYHAHSDESNPIISDSPIKKVDYIKRCLEIRSSVVSSVEHGWQGLFHKLWATIEDNETYKESIKPIFGTEAYWVWDRHKNDISNCHMIILAKNNNGRKAINRMLSQANRDGMFNGRPRIDKELIFNLPPSDVFITTACLAFWQKYEYDDLEKFVLELKEYFKQNFMLEVQNHDSKEQKDLNSIILTLSRVYDIPIICGYDSHYIYSNQGRDRDELLLSKGINYNETESSWYMDFPIKEDAYLRFLKQGELSHEEIIQAMNNTNITLSFENYYFDRTRKLPTIYPSLSQKEKDSLYLKIITDQWNKDKESIPTTEHKKYIEAIKEEVRVVINTKTSDYFLFDHELIKKGIEKGGILTSSGRGSASSFITNNLLGFTKMDRVKSKVKLFPERFMSEARILQSGQLPDIDMNVANRECFIEAQKELVKEPHVAPMISMGQLKAPSAFKMFCRSQIDKDGNPLVPPEIANEVTKQMERYTHDRNKAEDDEKENYNIEDYVDEKYHHYLHESRKYLGIIDSWSAHPCSFIVTPQDVIIEEEFGLKKIVSKQTKEEVLVACIEGATADEFGYVKNDLLIVTVYKIIDSVCNRVGIPRPTISELENLVEGNEKVWNLYANGQTCCVNQCESDGTKAKLKAYKPSSISELCAFVAGIRPAFKSMWKKFASREPFSYGIDALDKILQTEDFPYSYILYQEQIMEVLGYAGYPMDETMTVIKFISKKKEDKLRQVEQVFKNGSSDGKIIGFTRAMMRDDETLSYEEALRKTNQVWTIIIDAGRYGFNASHSLAYAYDSVFCAWLKATYPYEFYETCLRIYTEKGNKNKCNEIVKEMTDVFGISLGEFKFRRDNRICTANKMAKCIEPDISTIKRMNNKIAENLYQMKDIQASSFTDILVHLLENTPLTKTHIETLIKINYFGEFANPKQLLAIYEIFQRRYKKTHKEATKQVRKQEVIDFEKNIDPNMKFTLKEQLKNEKECMDRFITITPNSKYDFYAVESYDDKYGIKFVLYNLKTGEREKYTVAKKDWNTKPFKECTIMIKGRHEVKANGDFRLLDWKVLM